jgi:hypothetical protein
MNAKISVTVGTLAMLLLCVAADPASAARVALVIGNDAYTHVNRLSNAGNDARLMAGALKDAGFDVVGGVRLNLDRKAMWKALDEFQVRIAKGDEVVFYYAGHGVQIEANSLLLPVDIEAESDDQVARDGINIVAVQDEVKNARFALMVIDACRDNPFPPKPGHTRGIGTNGGIIPIEPARGNVILLSASRNQQALDQVPGVTKANGLFTYTLVQVMRTPGIDVIDALHTVRQQVEQQARMANPPHEQRPALVEEMDGQFAFFPKAGAGMAAPAAPPPRATQAPINVVSQAAPDTPAPRAAAPARLTPGGPYSGWATTNLFPGVVGSGTVTVNTDGTIDTLAATGDRTHTTPINLSDPNNVVITSVTHLGRPLGIQERYPDGSTSTTATLTGRFANGKISGTWYDKFQHGQFEWTVGPSQ